MQLMTPEIWDSELEQRDCKKVGKLSNGYTVWEILGTDHECFSAPPPSERLPDGRMGYPDWMLDDLIREVGLPAARKKH